MGTKLINLFTEFMNDEDYDRLAGDCRVKEYEGLLFSTSNHSDGLQGDYFDIEILRGESVMVEIINEKHNIYDVDVNIAFIETINNYINDNLFHNDFNYWIKNVEKLFLELCD